MILGHHGLLTYGSTAADALFRMSILQRASEVQVAAAFGRNWRPLSEEVLRRTARQMRSEVARGFDQKVAFGDDALTAYRRDLEQEGRDIEIERDRRPRQGKSLSELPFWKAGIHVAEEGEDRGTDVCVFAPVDCAGRAS